MQVSHLYLIADRYLQKDSLMVETVANVGRREADLMEGKEASTLPFLQDRPKLCLPLLCS